MDQIVSCLRMLHDHLQLPETVESWFLPVGAEFLDVIQDFPGCIFGEDSIRHSQGGGNEPLRHIF